MILAAALALAATLWSWRRPARLLWSLWVFGLLHGFALLVAGPELLRLKELLLLALLVRLATDREARTLAQRVPLGPLVALVCLALISLLASPVGGGQALLGLRSTLQWPLLALGACAYLDRRAVERGLTLLLPVLAFSSALAVWQYRSSVASLLRFGYSYFLNVREDQGVVRAFGGMTYSIPFGHSMAILALAYLVCGVAAQDRRSRLVGALGLGLTLVGLLCSGNRTALLGFAVSAAAGGAALLGPRVGRRSRQRLAVLALGAVLLAVGVLALSTPARQVVVRLAQAGPSVTARVETWRVVASDADPLLGNGPGSFGVAALPRGASASDASRYFGRGIVDNYYVTTYGQYGIAGLGLLLAWLLLLGRRARRSGAPLASRATAIACLSYLALAMLTLNIWEDFPQPVYLWSFIGAGLRGASAPARERRGVAVGLEHQVEVLLPVRSRRVHG